MQRLRKVLITNRGEIACRIARTCRALGLGVATVHSTADRLARHVREIGESIEVGGALPAESYLNISALIDAAKRVGADAIHPGYGFVSENAHFVRAVDRAGLAFIGPTAETIERIGGKANAKREAAALGLPIIPGSEGGLADPTAVAALVRGMSLPVLLKAVAGGGGRGMAIIDSMNGLEARIESAMREAEKAFGNGELIVERYLPHVRHIEVQIAGDGNGEAIHLFERECTLQRRHQKVIEEAPAAQLRMQTRDAILKDAVNLARAVNYRGLGTVEFVVSGNEHYFLEVNPRLQVEHPVTEAVTGLDLVELQLLIADGQRLPLSQVDVMCEGHAFEARLCAEDPYSGFMPATGRLELVDFSRLDVRVDSGVETGDEISPNYDSMIAKVIAHRSTRDAARQALKVALQQSVVLGPTTNLRFLVQLLEWPETSDGSFHTRLIDERASQGAFLSPAVPTIEHVCAAALYWLAERRADSPDLGCWTRLDRLTGWRLSLGEDLPTSLPSVTLASGDREWSVRFATQDREGNRAVVLGDLPQVASLRSLTNGRYLLQCDGRAIEMSIAGDERRVELTSALGSAVLECRPFLGGASQGLGGSGQLIAPMMGKIVAVEAKVGDPVNLGQIIVVLESMKMELHVVAPFAGVVSSLRCGVGNMVERHQLLVELAAAPSE